MMADALFIGLMSGTSLDGVDAALVSFSLQKVSGKLQSRVVHTHFLPYSNHYRTAILALQHPADNELEATALLSNQLAKLYAQTVNQLLAATVVSAKQVTAIGCHGQTIRHCPEKQFTLQIGNAALLAELTGISVVNDFRSRDIAAGGQGAPLVPAFHLATFGDTNTNRMIINIGGIANITYLPTDGKVIGFDTGPGNMLMDAWIGRNLQKPYDENGNWAATGKVIAPLLNKLLAHEYFKVAPPKSTGRDLFNMPWLSSYLNENAKEQWLPQDVERTLLELTALSIFDAIKRYSGEVEEIYLCGGGAYNTLLVRRLEALLKNVKIQRTDALGIDASYAEAVAFAWLAKQCVERKTGNLPLVTGAIAERVLGAIYYN